MSDFSEECCFLAKNGILQFSGAIVKKVGALGVFSPFCHFLPFSIAILSCGQNAILTIGLSKLNFRQRNKTMAVAIRSIPTLQGEDAERFLKEADYAEKNERKQDFGDKILLVRNFLREQGF